MVRKLHNEIDNLKKLVLYLSGLVEENVKLSLNLLKRPDMEVAKTVIVNDTTIDRVEIDVENECLRLIATQQPVAIDLRFIVVVLLLNKDLERIGDHASNIARDIIDMTNGVEDPESDKIINDLLFMALKAQQMLEKSLDALIKLDSDLAREVCAADDEVDNCNVKIVTAVNEIIQKDPSQFSRLIHMILISRHIERIADLATNISEEVIYINEGRIVRHGQNRFPVG